MIEVFKPRRTTKTDIQQSVVVVISNEDWPHVREILEQTDAMHLRYV